MENITIKSMCSSGLQEGADHCWRLVIEERCNQIKRSNPSVNTITTGKRNNSIKFQTVTQHFTTAKFSLQFFNTGDITIQENFVDEWKVNELPVLGSIVNELGPLTAEDLPNEDSVKSALLNAHWINNCWLEYTDNAVDSSSI